MVNKKYVGDIVDNFLNSIRRKSIMENQEIKCKKIWKDFIKIILSIIFGISLALITLSYIFESTVTKTFSQEILSKKISGYFLDEIIYDVDINELEKIENNIRISKYTNKISIKTIQTIVKNLGYNENLKLDISKEIDSLILENMPKELYNEKAQSTKVNLTKNLTNIEEKLERNVIELFGKQYATILKTYNVLTSINLRIAMMLTSVISIIVLVILERTKVLKIIQINIIIIMTFTIIAFVIIKKLSNFIDQRLAGGWLSEINLQLMIIFIIIEFIISLVLFIIRKKFIMESK